MLNAIGWGLIIGIAIFIYFVDGQGGINAIDKKIISVSVVIGFLIALGVFLVMV